VLTEQQKRLYSRQVLLAEVGTAGQARVCDAKLLLASEGDARAAAVAADYLRRAGAHVDHDGSDASVLVTDATSFQCETVLIPSISDTRDLAGDELLEDCAAWLAGSFAAVEALKRVVGVGRPAQIPAGFILNGEVD
jgi:hypothetical protein